MTALYAFMRIADDRADAEGNQRRKKAAVADWGNQLRMALAGCRAHPVLPALADTVRRFGIEPRWLHELLDGVASDVEPGRRFATLADLGEYCRLVAGTVGLCCLRVWGCTAAVAEPLALAAGRAFQMTNILRDLREDRNQGRCYLPLDWLKQAGIDEADLGREPNGPAAIGVYRRLGEEALRNYGEATGLAPLLPPPGRAMWQAMSGAYRELLATLRRRDFDPTLPRARLGRLTKARLFLRALPTRIGF